MIPQYPLPHLEDLVVKIKGKHFLAAIDLTKEYWQMPVKVEDQSKTTFVSKFGNFEYLRVPMGISGAVAYYQSEVHELLGQIDLDNEHQFIKNYVDDVCIGANTYPGYIDCVVKCFIKMKEKNMAISIKKSTWGTSEVEYLGFIAMPETWYPKPGQIAALAVGSAHICRHRQC